MKDTKGRIIDTALKLFNLQGLSQVTLRTIAKEMEISQGNLNYHFKKREDIIEAIYFRLVKEMDGSMSKMEHSEIHLELILAISTSIMNNAFKYRFFLLDFTQIMREHKTIKKHHSKLIAVRESETVGLFGLFAANGIMRKEELPNEYIHLYKRIQIFSDFWMASAEVENIKLEKKLIRKHLRIIMQSIYPYLTTKGKKQYKSLSF